MDPEDFRSSENIVHHPFDRNRTEYSITNRGLKFEAVLRRRNSNVTNGDALFALFALNSIGCSKRSIWPMVVRSRSLAESSGNFHRTWLETPGELDSLDSELFNELAGSTLSLEGDRDIFCVTVL
jgi:hypothetical protein